MARYASFHQSSQVILGSGNNRHIGPEKNKTTWPYMILICHILFLLHIIIFKIMKIMTKN